MVVLSEDAGRGRVTANGHWLLLSEVPPQLPRWVVWGHLPLPDKVHTATCSPTFSKKEDILETPLVLEKVQQRMWFSSPTTILCSSPIPDMVLFQAIVGFSLTKIALNINIWRKAGPFPFLKERGLRKKNIPPPPPWAGKVLRNFWSRGKNPTGCFVSCKFNNPLWISQ